VICPACGFDNLQGVDECENCGADLRTSDIPRPAAGLEARLVRDHLEDVRSRAPVMVSPETPVRVAVRRMQDDRTNCLLVGDGGRLTGIFTERDAVLKLAGRAMDGIRVADVMTPDPVVLRTEDTIAVAVHKMALGGFRHIPLVEDGRVKGIVTAQDLFRHILQILG
jgi:CBS domain-containing protein